MPQILWNPNKIKLLLSGFVLLCSIYVYFDFLLDIGDMYPNMIWDEVVSGLLGAGLVVIWYRFAAKL